VFTKLLGLQYKILYKKGVENHVADALSRRDHSSAQLCILSTASPQWLLTVQNSYAHDAFAKELITKLSLDPSSVPHYTLQDGLLRFKGRVWVGADSQVHNQIISALHCSAIGGHSGVPNTYRRLKNIFSWKGMKT
jgi:hypothetical protein